jgi:hypothetical protein
MTRRMSAVQAPAAVLAAAMLLAASGGVQAKGCIKGAAVGAVAGHVAGHHAVVGAAAGCVIGHHIAKKRQQEQLQHPGPQSPSASPKQSPT